jgi:hypothetical protein
MQKALILIACLISSMTAYRFQDVLNSIPTVILGKEYGNNHVYIKLIEANGFEVPEDKVNRLYFQVQVKIRTPSAFWEGKVNAFVFINLT